MGDERTAESSGDAFGNATSLSSDGTVVAIGGYQNSGGEFYSGHVRVFRYLGGNWGQVGSDIDGEDEYDQIGYSVAISKDSTASSLGGTIVAMGAPQSHTSGSSNHRGYVQVWEYDSDADSWNQLGSNIDGEEDDDWSGFSVALSSDGTIVAIGAPYNDEGGSNRGHVRVYQWDGTLWNKLGDDIDGADFDTSRNDDKIGYSVSISSDGSIVACGSDGEFLAILEYDGTSWNQLGSNVDSTQTGDRWGWTIGLSDDGTIVASGAINNDDGDTNAGQVRMFGYTAGITTTTITGGTANISEGTVTGMTLTDGDATLTDGTLSNLTSVSANTITDGSANLSGGTLTSDLVIMGAAAGGAPAPASAGATGIAGEIRVADGYIYICTATNVWVRFLGAIWQYILIFYIS